MAQDRVVKVTLTAQMQNYLAGMEKARKVTRDAATEADKLAATKQGFDVLGRSALLVGGALATGLAVAVKRFADFDQAMSNVAATGEDARQNLNALREAAIDAGASTVFSAEESANAIENLAKAGLSASDILGGALKGSLDLAAAGGLGVAEAGEIAATTLQQFGLAGSDAVHVADLLAAGAGKAMGDVGDMAQALKQSGLVANQFGISVEETTGALAAFANQGLLGSDAGTSFRTMLLRLANPTGEVKDLMEELGIETYNANGQFVGLAGLAGELETALAGMTDQQRQATLAQIFGQDAIRAATILYDEGAAGIAEWTAAVDDAGYAAETAETRLDNLAGDLEALQGAIDSAFITMGSAADGPLRAFVQALTSLVDGFNELPTGAQQAVFWVGAFAATGATALGSYLLLVPKVAEFNAALEALGPRAQAAARGVQRIAAVAGGATAGILAAIAGADLLTQALAAVGDSAEVTANKVKTARDAVALLDAANGALSTSNIALATEQVERLGDVLEGVGADGSGGIISATTLTAVQQLGAELAELAGEDLPAAQSQFRLLADAAGLTERQQALLLEQMEPYKTALTAVATEAGTTADEQALLNLAMGEGEDKARDNESALRALAGQAEGTEEAVEGLSDTIRNFGAATLSTRDAQRQFEQALDDLTASVEEHGATLDIDTQAGRENQAALDDIAKSALDLAASLYEQTGSQEDATAAVESGRQKLIEALKQFGITGQAAEDYADELGLIPENISTYVSLNTQDAQAAINRFIFANDGRRINLVVDGVAGRQVHGSDVIARASGGAVYGPGTSTSDSVPAMLSTGEHVLTAADVAAMGGQNAVYAFRSALHGGGGGSGGASTPPVVYVQNPWGPEYMEAQVAGVADARIQERNRVENVRLSRRGF